MSSFPSPVGAICIYRNKAKQMNPHTSPWKLAPVVDVPVRPPRTGLNTPGVRGLGLEFFLLVVFEVRRAATRCAAYSLRVLLVLVLDIAPCSFSS